MIIRVNRPTVFIQPAFFRKGSIAHRLSMSPKHTWIVVQLMRSAIRNDYEEVLLPLCDVLGLDRDSTLVNLIHELERDSKALAVLSDDALIVHPQSFGIALIKLGKKTP